MKNVRPVLNSMIVLATGSTTNLRIKTKNLIQVSKNINAHSDLTQKAKTHI